MPKLNVGCGSTKLDGFVNLDVEAEYQPDVLAPCWDLPFGPESIDEIYCSHVLEHLFDEARDERPLKTIRRTLNEFFRVLKPGGRLRVAVPNLEAFAHQFLHSRSVGVHQLCTWITFATQKPRLNGHAWGFTPLTLWHELFSAGFLNGRPFRSNYHDQAGAWERDERGEKFDLSLNLECDRSVHGPIGIGIVAFHHPIVYQAIERLKAHTKHPHVIAVYDNGLHDPDHPDDSNWREIGTRWPEIHRLAGHGNDGVARSRNALAAWLRRRCPQMRFLALFDTDVLVKDGWLEDYLEVMEDHPRAGVVSVPNFNMGWMPVFAGGLVSEIAGGANFYRLPAWDDLGGWDPRIFLHSGDSLLCQMLNRGCRVGRPGSGHYQPWRTYLVTKYLQPGVPWLRQPSAIEHSPHTSMHRFGPRAEQRRVHARDDYRRMRAEYDIASNWDPDSPLLAAGGSDLVPHLQIETP